MKEVFTGRIQGKRASDLEERTARAFDKLGIPYNFRWRVLPGGVLASGGENHYGELEVDFLASWRNAMYAFAIDGKIAHYFAAWQRERDEKKTTQINAVLRKYGMRPLIRVPYVKLVSQEAADTFYRDGFLSEWAVYQYNP